MKKPELLAPAGNFEKMKMAFHYGADAVYLGGEAFGLRASADNFTMDEMKEAVQYAHKLNKKIYVTANIIAHNRDLKEIPEYIKQLDEIGVDAVLVADLGIFGIVREVAPNLEIHISTQANITNYETANMWVKMGAKRIVLAREISINEVKEIRAKIPADIEIEAFVHGAMCISYSGRCLLSNYMANRESNLGMCAHPCRWQYYVVEEKRPGEYMPIYENERGTFIFNSNDLCLIEHIPELIEAGIDSLKIEGRMKSSYYVAHVIRSYRAAIDNYIKDSQNYKFNEEWLTELSKASHRNYTTGFYFKKPKSEDHNYETTQYTRGYEFMGLVLDYDESTKLATVEQRNRIFVGDTVEVFGPEEGYKTQKIEVMYDDKGESIEVAPHPQQIIKIKIDFPVKKYDMLRKENEE